MCNINNFSVHVYGGSLVYVQSININIQDLKISILTFAVLTVYWTVSPSLTGSVTLTLYCGSNGSSGVEGVEGSE